MKLIRLAHLKFGHLTLAEMKLFQNIEAGNDVDYQSGDDQFDHPSNACNWPKDRCIKADRITWLYTDKIASEYLPQQGIEIFGIKIDGRLDLGFAKLQFPLEISKSYLPDGAYLRGAEIPELNLQGSHSGPINADGITVKRSLFLSKGFKAFKEVRLLGASIGGNLDCSDGWFLNHDKKALSADGITIKGSLFLRDGFKAYGEVRLPDASIGGTWDCRKGLFSNPNPNQDALYADRIKVSGKMLLGNNFKALGEVSLHGATVGGNLDCSNGKFINNGEKALKADGIIVKGSVFLRNNFYASGEVRLIGATIGGMLDCSKSNFLNKGKYALSLDGITVQGSIYMRDNLLVEGEVSLAAAIVRHSLQWHGLKSRDDVILDLRTASIGLLYDQEDSWPRKNNLKLQGFTYNAIADKSPTNAESRQNWLSCQSDNDFSPQPYEQLAKVLTNSGHEEDAREILIAKNENPSYLKKMGKTRHFWHQQHGRFLGYGYRPWVPLTWAVAIMLLWTVFFEIGYQFDLLVPTGKPVQQSYPAFTSLIYSADTFVPLVDLRQAKYWRPAADEGGEIIKIPKILGGHYIIRWGGILCVAMWLEIALGWLLTSLLAVGLTGLIRRST